MLAGPPGSCLRAVLIILAFLSFQEITLQAATPFSTNQDEFEQREGQVLKFSRYLGTLSGSSMGIFVLYIRYVEGSSFQGELWKTMVVSIPSMVAGAYVGSKTTPLFTGRIIRNQPGLMLATVRGIVYGGLEGAIIGVVTMPITLILGKATGEISFNQPMSYLQLLGVSTFAGAVFGGMIGAGVGVVYGPAITYYIYF